MKAKENDLFITGAVILYDVRDKITVWDSHLNSFLYELNNYNWTDLELEAGDTTGSAHCRLRAVYDTISEVRVLFSLSEQVFAAHREQLSLVLQQLDKNNPEEGEEMKLINEYHFRCGMCGHLLRGESKEKEQMIDILIAKDTISCLLCGHKLKKYGKIQKRDRRRSTTKTCSC